MNVKQSNMVAKDRLSKTDSPIGEIDTRAPFQSVKDAVNLFGEGAFSGEKAVIRKSKPHSAERVFAKETQLHIAQKEVSKLKEQLKSAETTKAEALVELEGAKTMLQDLKNKLQAINEAKESVIKATEMSKNQAKQLDNGQSNGVWKQDLSTTKADYSAVVAELDAAKKELTKIQQDHEAVMEQKSAAFKLATEAEFAGKMNLDRVDELSKEIASVRESIEQVKLATLESQREHGKICSEKSAQKQSCKAALEEYAKKLLALRKESNPEISKGLEIRLAETTSEIESLQKETEGARASDLNSLKAVTSELDGAKASLQTVVEEERSLKRLSESLKIELENVKKQHVELKEKEAEMESVAGNLHVKLRKSKSELEAVCAEESRANGASEEMLSTLQQLLSERDNARREAEETKQHVEESKTESEATRHALEEAEAKLTTALAEAEEAKAAEAKALETIKLASEKTDAARVSASSSSSGGSRIMLSQEEFESLTRKVEESEKLAKMRVEAAMAQADAVRASEHEALKRLEAAQKEIDEMKAATEAAIKRAQMAEAAKKAVEGELRKWREREQKKAEDAASRILQDSTASSEMANQRPKTMNVQRFEKSRHLVTKKVLVSNLSGIFQRKKSQVDRGGGCSPSYLPGEKPM